MFKLLVNILVGLFCKKKNRAKYKYYILGTANRIRVVKLAKSVGKNLKCSGVKAITVNKYTSIGDNVVLNGLEIYGSGEVNIGNGVVVGPGCVICSDNHNYEGDAIPFGRDVIKKQVCIGDYCWLGTRVIILPGTKIGEGAIIQAGAVVHGEIPPYAIAGGNPAIVFKYRNKEHFEQMKLEGKLFSDIN